MYWFVFSSFFFSSLLFSSVLFPSEFFLLVVLCSLGLGSLEEIAGKKA
ncbi:hypothetical protein [Plesiomonas shigelloides]|nr:hypothetical protein [Plesiomonas shigelloides]